MRVSRYTVSRMFAVVEMAMSPGLAIAGSSATRAALAANQHILRRERAKLSEGILAVVRPYSDDVERRAMVGLFMDEMVDIEVVPFRADDLVWSERLRMNPADLDAISLFDTRRIPT